MGSSERLCPGSGGSRPHRSRALAGALRTGPRAGAQGQCSARRSRGIHDPRSDGHLGRPGARRRDPARCGHLARPRPGSDRGCAEDSGTRSGKMTPMKALVTGGAGFIGSNLVDALLERGDDVRVLDNFSTGNRANLESGEVEIVEGELRSYERVHAAMRGVEVVYHLGALGSVPRSVQDPLTSNAVNVEGTLNVLLAARDEGVRRVVFSSSTSVYGTSPSLPTSESTPTDPISPYGVTKLAAERYCISFSRVYHSFEAVVLRYFNVFGPRQSPQSQYAAAVPLFIAAIDAGEPITIYGDGEQSRDFTYVANIVDATIRAAEAPGASGRVFNIAAGSPASVNHLAETIGAILGKPVEKRFEPPRPGDIRDSWGDITAARETLGYEPQVDLAAGLELTAEAIVARV